MQALWVQFKPDTSVADSYSWSMSKIGSPISPLEVVCITSVLMLCLRICFCKHAPPCQSEAMIPSLDLPLWARSTCDMAVVS